MGLLAIILLAACNAAPGVTPAPTTEPSAAPSTSPTVTPEPQVTPAPSPTDGGPSDEAVVRIELVGGMMPQWITLTWYPSVVLYADGRLIMQGPQDLIYPGPALPNLRVTHLTQDGIEQVLAWAAEAGMNGDDRQLGPMLLDSGQTVFTIVSSDGTHRTSVTDMTADDPEIAAVRHFEEVLLGIRDWLPGDVVGEDQPYAFDGLRVISSLADPASVDPELSSTLDWPLDEPISTLGFSLAEPENERCVPLEGDDLQTLMPLFRSANQLTLWRSEDTLYQFTLRPLLPDEEACPGY